MKCPAFLLLLIICLNTISCQEEGGGDEPTGGHDQPPPDQSNQQNPDTSKGEKGPDGKPAGEQGYTQGFNQGVKPYSYGYNTGIKPYSYNFYQPLGGKPQVVEQGGPDGDKGSPEQKVTSTAGVSAQPSPPPMPAIEFPAVSSIPSSDLLYSSSFAGNLCLGLFCFRSESGRSGHSTTSSSSSSASWS